MHKINEIIKGFLIGIANIIPGVSGGTLAVLVGVYDTLTYNIGQIFSHPLKAIKSLLFIILGMVLGVVSGYFIIGKFLLLVLPLEMSFILSFEIATLNEYLPIYSITFSGFPFGGSI